MPHRDPPPQLAGDLFITDGGMETTLIFRHGLDLPSFASFTLLDTTDGTEALRSYFDPYLAVARTNGVGLVLDTPTWRANRDWGERLGYSQDALDEVNRKGVALLEDIRAANPETPIVVSGCVGPRGDGYAPSELMTAAEAEDYHARQIATFADTATDMISALTLNYVDEAVGVVRTARAAGMPVVISFTVETDGRLPSGQGLQDAIEQTDAETGGAASYFMVNCAHPTHFADVLDGEAWVDRLGGLRANASRKSHQELDEAEELDDGDPVELAAQYRELKGRLRNVNVVGGCCGTDERHVGEICRAWLAAP